MTRRATGVFRHGNEAPGEPYWVSLDGIISYPLAPAQALQVIAAISKDGEEGR